MIIKTNILMLLVVSLWLTSCSHQEIQEANISTPKISTPKTSKPAHFTCKMSPQAGSCRAAIPRFFYDSQSSKCEQFSWGGCGGTVPFQTLEACQLACETSPRTTKYSHLKSIQKSEQLWQSIKSYYPDYHYEVLFSSWVGFRHSTIVRINEHQVNSREYKAWDAQRRLAHYWKELGSEVGLHAEGAAPLTLDQLYTRCEQLIGNYYKDNNRFRLKFDEQGLLKSCSYSSKQCADDCSQGIEIENLNLKY